MKKLILALILILVAAAAVFVLAVLNQQKGISVQPYADLIKVNTPLPGATVQGPLEVSGEARGMWYFEAVFPVRLLDGNGNEIARAQAQAQSEWTTGDFVPFKATLTFDAPATASGTLVLANDNPSGLSQNAKEVRVPVKFAVTAPAAKSGINGKVVIGPTCPVERIPPDPNCAPKPYPTVISISKSATLEIYKIITTDSAAAFKVELPPGTYTFTPQSSGFYPRCSGQEVQVLPNKFTDITLQCDSGIR